jgi:hypothetical protein
VIPKELLEAYSSAIVTDLQGNDLAETDSLPFPLFIITAHNPYSIKTDSINDALHECLQIHLAEHFPGAQWEEVVGQSKDGQWREASLAIAGINKEDAIAVGKHFAQWAVFSLDYNGLTIIPCAP